MGNIARGKAECHISSRDHFLSAISRTARVKGSALSGIEKYQLEIQDTRNN